MTPRVGDKVTVVIEGEVIGVDRATPGLFDLDYGPGWVTVADGMQLEESKVVQGLVEYARRGVAWNKRSADGDWVCPRCEYALLTGMLAERGAVCSACRRALAERDVTRDVVENALDFFADYLGDAGLDKAEVWRVLKERRDEIVDDAIG